MYFRCIARPGSTVRDPRRRCSATPASTAAAPLERALAAPLPKRDCTGVDAASVGDSAAVSGRAHYTFRRSHRRMALSPAFGSGGLADDDLERLRGSESPADARELGERIDERTRLSRSPREPEVASAALNGHATYPRVETVRSELRSLA